MRLHARSPLHHDDLHQHPSNHTPLRTHLSIAALARMRATPRSILLASSKCLGDSQDMLNRCCNVTGTDNCPLECLVDECGAQAAAAQMCGAATATAVQACCGESALHAQAWIVYVVSERVLH
jgi:hypothetical protein